MPGRLRRPPCQGEVLVMQYSSGKGLAETSANLSTHFHLPTLATRPQPDIEVAGRSPCTYLTSPVHAQIHGQHTHTPRHMLGYLAPPTNAYRRMTLTGWWLQSRHRSLVPIFKCAEHQRRNR